MNREKEKGIRIGKEEYRERGIKPLNIGRKKEEKGWGREKQREGTGKRDGEREREKTMAGGGNV